MPQVTSLKLYDGEATIASGEAPDAPISNQQVLDKAGMEALAEVQSKGIGRIEVVLSPTEVACGVLNAFINQTLNALGKMLHVWESAGKQTDLGSGASEYADGAFVMMKGQLANQAERVRHAAEHDRRLVEARKVILSADLLAKRVNVQRNSAPGIELFKVLMLVLHQLAHPEKRLAERQYALDLWAATRKRIAAQV